MEEVSAARNERPKPTDNNFFTHNSLVRGGDSPGFLTGVVLPHQGTHLERGKKIWRKKDGGPG